MAQIKKFTEKYDNRSVYYDPAFQRRVVWSNHDISKYLVSLTRGWALTTIVVANVKECLKHCTKLGDESSMEYFQNILDQGYSYISLDGQNRTKSIINVLGNEVSISGNFRDADEKVVKIENKFFDNLPQRLKDAINHSRVIVKVADPCPVEHLSELFRALNDGQPLNAQETRNSFISPIATWVRKISEKNTEALVRITKGVDITRMIDDENVAKMAMVLMDEWDLRSGEIDRFYELGLTYSSLADPKSPYAAKDICRAESILGLWRHAIVKQKVYSAKSKLVAAKMAWAALYACEWAHDHGYYIKDYEQFFSELKKIDDDLSHTSNIAYVNERTRYLDAGVNPDDVSSEKYYFKWQHLPHRPHARRSRKKELYREFVSKASLLSLRKKAPKTQAA
jgi:hypothetical protein